MDGGEGVPGRGEGDPGPAPRRGTKTDVDAAMGSFALAGRVILADGTFLK